MVNRESSSVTEAMSSELPRVSARTSTEAAPRIYDSRFTIHKSPLFVLAGPTASGKSTLALRLAEEWGAEIVGADAFQLYDGLPLLSAQPDAAVRAQVPHHLVGAFSLAETMSAGRWLAAARAAIADIHARGRRALVVGGTGLYLRSLLHGLDAIPPADPALRAELEARPLADLVEELRRVAPRRAEQIDLRNPRRVVRALEIVRLDPAERDRILARPAERTGEAPPAGVWLRWPRAELHARIAARTEEMFARGVLAEVAATQPESIGPTAGQMLGLADARACLRGEMTQAECRARLTAATRQYARRQETWLRREPALMACEASGEVNDPSALLQRLRSALRPAGWR